MTRTPMPSTWLLAGLLAAAVSGCSSNAAPAADSEVGADTRGPDSGVDTQAPDSGVDAPVPDAAADQAQPDQAQPDSTPEQGPPDAAGDVAPWPCPTITGSVFTTIKTGVLGEASGMAAGRVNPEVFWIHNDSGSNAELYAIGTQGQLLGTYRLVGIEPDDWEDIAIGPGPTPGVHYIHVGDIGDNSADRASIFVYRFAEPVVPLTGPPLTVDVTVFDKIELVYPTTFQLPPPLPSFGGFNAEGLMVDPLTADLYVVTKRGSEPEEIYVSAAPQDTTAARKLTLAATLTVGPPPLTSTVDSLSAADISPAGDEIVLRNEKEAFIWNRPAGATIAEALLGNACIVEMLPEPNGEAITYGADKTLYGTSEGGNQPIHAYSR